MALLSEVSLERCLSVSSKKIITQTPRLPPREPFVVVCRQFSCQSARNIFSTCIHYFFAGNRTRVMEVTRNTSVIFFCCHIVLETFTRWDKLCLNDSLTVHLNSGDRTYRYLVSATTTRLVEPELYFHYMHSLVGMCLWFPQVNERRLGIRCGFARGQLDLLRGEMRPGIRADHRTATGVSAHVAALAQFEECVLLGMSERKSFCYSLAVIIKLQTTWVIYCDFPCPPTAVRNRSDV